MRTLCEVGCGETITVVRIHGDGRIKRRILEMGLTKGSQFYVRKVVPLGDPIELTVRGYELSIRKDDAEMVEVEMAGGNKNGN